MSLEIERKYLDVDFSQLRARLAELGAKSFGAHFEANLLFDFPGNKLFAENKLLRLRTNEWPGAVRHILTYKGPGHTNARNFKMREEIECELADANSMREILLACGFAETARYEKIREAFRLVEFPHIEIALDIVPFARVVELEGEPDGCQSVEKLLGLDKYRSSAKSYHAIHQEWRQQNGLEPRADFIFSPEQRKMERQRLGLDHNMHN